MEPNNCYIYVIITREFINAQQNIFKIGRTKNIAKRFSQYPKGSILLFSKFVINDMHIENELCALLSLNFIQRNDIGREYFQGFSDVIIHTVENCIKQLEHDFNKQTYGIRCFQNTCLFHHPKPIDKSKTIEEKETNKDKEEQKIQKEEEEQKIKQQIQKEEEEKKLKKKKQKEEEKKIKKHNENKTKKVINKPSTLEKTLISSFYNENKNKYIDKILPSQDVYQHFLQWLLETKQDNISIPHKAFNSNLKDIFFNEICIKPHHFPDGKFLAIFFQISQKSSSIHLFLQEYIQKQNDCSVFLSLKSIKEVYKNSPFFDGTMINVADIENEFQVHCVPKKKNKCQSFSNVFLGLSFRI